MSEPFNEPESLPENSPSLSPRRLKRLILLIIIPLILLIFAGVIYLQGGRFVETDNAYLKADTVPVSIEVAGTVKEIFVKENELVSAGQLLFRIDALPYQVKVDMAKAELAQ